MHAAHTRHEKAFSSVNGYLAAVAGVVLLLVAVYLFGTGEFPAILASLVMGLATAVCLGGLYMLQPNESAILTLFGKYIGTDRSEGLRWAFPLYKKRRLSLRARNFNAPTLKVNDKRGNPVEISAAVVWRVRDTAQAVFDVDDFERYVSIQAEAALRHLASQYAYDEGEDLPEGEPRCAPAWTWWPTRSSASCRRVSKRRVSRCSMQSSPIWHMLPRLRRSCCVASRPRRSSAPAPRSCTAPSAWSKRR